MNTNNHSQRNPFSNLSLWFLVFSNVVTIVFAISENWNLSTILLVYWFQSMTIGFFNFIRILQLKEFSTEGFRINGQPVRPAQHSKIFTAFFFLFHYSGFHAFYLLFFLNNAIIKAYGNVLNSAELKYVLLMTLLFFINHLFSYYYNRPLDAKKQKIGSLMLYPYIRIIPMHLTMMSGATFLGALPFFLVLKTFADVIMHSIEHSVLWRDELQNV